MRRVLARPLNSTPVLVVLFRLFFRADPSNRFPSGVGDQHSSNVLALAATVRTFPSVAGEAPFFNPRSASWTCWNAVNPATSKVFFAHSVGHPSMTRIFPALWVLLTIPGTCPPRPARQYILPTPSLVRARAARSAVSPTSAAPEQAKIRVGAVVHSH